MSLVQALKNYRSKCSDIQSLLVSLIPWEVSFLNLEATNCRPRSTSGGSIALAYTDTLKKKFFFLGCAGALCGCAPAVL